MFPFGHGLSYTTFEYSDLEVAESEVPINGQIVVSFTVGNIGDRAGDEVVQLYVHEIAWRASPVRCAS